MEPFWQTSRVQLKIRWRWEGSSLTALYLSLYQLAKLTFLDFSSFWAKFSAVITVKTDVIKYS